MQVEASGTESDSLKSDIGEGAGDDDTLPSVDLTKQGNWIPGMPSDACNLNPGFAGGFETKYPLVLSHYC